MLQEKKDVGQKEGTVSICGIVFKSEAVDSVLEKLRLGKVLFEKGEFGERWWQARKIYAATCLIVGADEFKVPGALWERFPTQEDQTEVCELVARELLARLEAE